MNLYQDDIPSSVVFRDSVAIDTETMGLVTNRDRLCLVQLASSDGEVHMVQFRRSNYSEAENLKKLLVDNSVVKIFHFARFDVAALNNAFKIEVKSIYCTKVASKLVRTYTDKHGLKNLCKEILGVDLSKQEQSSDWGRENLSEEQLKYAANDVIYLHLLKKELDSMLQRENRTNLASECFYNINLISKLDLLEISPEWIFQH